MNTKQFLENLISYGELPVRFVLPVGDSVPGDYHITELQAAGITAVDCGGSIEHRREIVAQLLAGNSGEPMSADRVAGIFQRVLGGAAGESFDLEASLFVDYDGRGQQLARYPVTEVRLEARGVDVQLGSLRSVCRPSRSKTGSGCCG